MESKNNVVKAALMGAASKLASLSRSVKSATAATMAFDLNRLATPGAFGGGKRRHNPAGSKLARKVGSLTCRHPVGTHHSRGV